MKRRFFILAAVAAALLSSCTCNKHGDTNIEFDTLVVSQKNKLILQSADSLPYASIDIKCVYPKKFGSSEDLKKMQQLFYTDFFGQEYAKSASPQEAADKFAEDYTKRYRDDNIADFEKNMKEVYSGDGEDFPYHQYSHATSIYNKIEFTNSSLLSYTVFREDYMGGGRGTSYKTNVSINLSTLKKIAEADIFTEGYQEPLAQIIRTKLLTTMKENAGEEDDEKIKEDFYDFDSICANSNFRMDNKGLHYMYNTHEIMPFAAGLFEVEVFISYSGINHLLKPDILKEFQIGQ